MIRRNRKGRIVSTNPQSSAPGPSAVPGADPDPAEVAPLGRGGFAAATSAGSDFLDPELRQAYDEALEQGLPPVDVADTFAPARAGRVLEAVTAWRERIAGGPCAGCGSVSPRRGVDLGWRTPEPRFTTMDGRPACQWCEMTGAGSWDRLRGVVLQAVAGLRSAEWMAPADVLPLAMDITPAPACRVPFGFLGGYVLGARDWAAAEMEQVDFLPQHRLTEAFCRRVPGVYTLPRVIRSRRVTKAVLSGEVVRAPDAGFVPTVRSMQRSVDPRSKHIAPTPAVSHFVDLMRRRETAPASERAALDHRIAELVPIVEPQVDEMVALKKARRSR